MTNMVQKIFTSVEVEVEIEGLEEKPVFTWQRVPEKTMREYRERVSLGGLKQQLEAKKLTRKEGERAPKLSKIEKRALKVETLTVKELADSHLMGWQGVPGTDGPLEYSDDARADLLADPDWRLVLDKSFFEAQGKVPEILVKNVLTPGAGGRPAE